jgi:hypothetical protein
MNRIYQGKVTNVELANPDKHAPADKRWLPFADDPKQAKTKWQAALWQHHQLFQDAVNYYTLALAAMVEGLDEPKLVDSFIAQAIAAAEANPKFKESKKKEKAIEEARKTAMAKIEAVKRWRDQVSGKWFDVRKKAQSFAGPGKRLANQLQVNAAAKDCFVACSKAALNDSKARPAQRAFALLRLLQLAEEASDLSQLSVDKLPWLCSQDTSGKTDDAAKSKKLHKAQAFARAFRDPTAVRVGMRDDFDPGLFVQRQGARVTGKDAAKKLRGYFKKVAEAYPDVAKLEEKFESWLSGLPESYGFIPAGKRYQKEYPAAVLFKEWGQDKPIADAFADTCEPLAEKGDIQILETDPLKDARTKADARHFDYFTNVAFAPATTITEAPRDTENGDNDAEEASRAVWFEFDLAAFLEAVKAPHRYFQDTQAREAAADKLRDELTAMEGQGRTGRTDGENGEEVDLDGFIDDSRVQKIVKLVFVELAYLADLDSPGDDVPLREFITKSLETQSIKLPKGQREYTIRERTLRGWKTLRDKWRALAERGKATPDELWKAAAAEQAEHRFDAGSATLFKKLAQPEWHDVWLGKRTRDWHADDPLRAWLEYTELRRELADKERHIRFTPAHAEYSPRFFIFPKKSAAGGKWGSEHIAGVLAFTAGIAVRTKDGKKWETRMARFSFGAPRLRRDELRREGETTLETAPWLQPMMKALGLREPAEQDFGNCRITLQSGRYKLCEHEIELRKKRGEASAAEDGEFFDYNHQLTFPVDVDPTKLLEHLGKKDRWARQFGGRKEGEGKTKKFAPMFLFWPDEPRKAESKPSSLWYDALNSIQCLSVDLGQRDAGAYAVLDVRANHEFGKQPSRTIGESPGKQWRAALAASGLFQLSGEDRDEWRQKSKRDLDGGEGFAFREELHGSRGRKARDFETSECRDLLNALLGEDDAKEFLAAGKETQFSFPEQNDELLRAAKRAQWRVARLHRWCWFLGDDKKRDDALTEIRESLNAADEDAEHWLPDELRPFAEKDNDPRLKEELAKLLEMRLKDLPGLLVQLANRILPLHGRSWNWEAHPDATKDNRISVLTQKGASLDSKERPVWLRGQRGLSMKRIELIEELRRRFQSLNQTIRRHFALAQYLTKEWDKKRVGEWLKQEVPDPCPDLLEKLDNLKEQRVNQTAHMIMAEALGVRLAKPPANKAALKEERDQHGVYEKFREPVDFIVIEDLSRYRASQGRAPRENSRLMKWCHRAVRDKLRELCEPFGLPVLETPAAYSSRFCSRTGVPGFRAVEVTAGFENEVPWCWWKDKESDGMLTEEAQFLRRTAAELETAQKALDASWKPKFAGQTTPQRTLLLPQAGGPIFIPVVETRSNGKLNSAVVQADVNAAISLGLRAISDPRLWEIHPRLRTERTSGEVKKRGGKKKPKEAAGATPAKPDEPVRLKAREKRKYGENGPELNLGTPPKGSAVEDTRNPNYFRDVAGLAKQLGRLPEPAEAEDKRSLNFARMLVGQDKAEIPDPQDAAKQVELLSGKAFWGAVKKLQWRRCQEINEARLAEWKVKLNPKPG